MTYIPDLLPAYIEYLEHERMLAKSTVAAYSADLYTLERAVTKPLEEISQEDLRAFMRFMSKEGFSSATIHRKMHGLTTFWNWLMMENYLDRNPMIGLKLPRKREQIPAWLSADQLKLFAETKPRTAREGMAWALLAHLGLRRGELINLLWENVSVTDRTVTIRSTDDARTKNKRDRVLPMSTTLFNIFERYLITFKALPEPHQYVCPGSNGQRWLATSFTANFGHHLNRCGLGGLGIHPHTIRHSFATHMIRSGVPLSVVQDFLGHVDIKSTRKYIHHDPRFLKEAMDKYILNQ